MTSQTFMMQVASSICYTPCVITTTAVPPQMPPLAFSLTADSSATFLPAGAGAGTNFNQCANTDYLVIHGAVDSTMPTSFNDRFCGNNLNPASQTTSVTLCCKWHSFFRRDFAQSTLLNNLLVAIATAKPFNIFYRTDGSESNTEFANNGFCLRYEQRAS